MGRRSSRSVFLTTSSIVFLGFFGGCLYAPPMTEQLPLEAPCDGTAHGNACLLLRFSSTSAIREGSPESMSGILHWALYRGGDVGVLGPGDHDELYDGSLDDVDFAASDSMYEVVLADVPAQKYQVLAYVDHDRNGKSSSGDPVTFPSDAFEVGADKRTKIEVILNYLR